MTYFLAFNIADLVILFCKWNCSKSAMDQVRLNDILCFHWTSRLCLMPLTTVISWQSILVLEDPEKTTDLSQVTDRLYNIMLYTLPWSRFELTTSVVIGTDCIGSCKSNYHTITTMTAPHLLIIQFILDKLCTFTICKLGINKQIIL